MIRGLRLEDMELLERIHYEFYKDEFEMPNFGTGYLAGLAAVGDKGQIISAAGIRLIPEVVMITDKLQPIEDRRLALLELLRACCFVAEKDGFDQIHAFVQDEKWKRHLLKAGFRGTKGEALVLSF